MVVASVLNYGGVLFGRMREKGLRGVWRVKTAQEMQTNKLIWDRRKTLAYHTVPTLHPRTVERFQAAGQNDLFGSKRVIVCSPQPFQNTASENHSEVSFIMVPRKLDLFVACLAGAALVAPSVYAQSCTASSAAAVKCFVANAVTTKITAPRYGMTLAEFETYGVAVSQIVQTHHTYLILAGIASSISDAMPPTNANGSENQSAQDLAVSQIVTAILAGGFATPPSGATAQHLQWFTLDLVTAMNDNEGMLQMLTPGVGLRVIDSYIVTATTGGKVNWTEVDSSLSTAVDSFISAGLMTVPPGHTSAQVKTLVNSLAQAINTYKVSTKRAAL
ncbi:MAG TPA: hypothetical protein VN861_10685 [Candidatus Acidoferrales bacterium]|nr:hypothetical protein [Candidatus Acidoferrales bacterium]